MTKQALSILLFFFLFQNVSAEDTFWIKSKNKTEFYSLYFQDGLWRIDQFTQDDEDFIDLISRQSFSSEKKANEKLAQLKQKASPVSILSSFPLKKTTEVKGFLWKATEKWSWDWEVKYAKWVRQNVNKQFFADNNLPADCADAAFAFRWIFSRINHLPAANHLANGKWMTHETYRKSWEKLPQHQDWQNDKRFLRALNDLLDSTYTHSLMRDSYPVAINPESFMEGVHHLELFGPSGHTMIVNEVNSNDSSKIPMKLIWATVPRDLANLTEGGYWHSHLPTQKESGFFRMLWPIKKSSAWVFEKKQNIPHYSEEQYNEEFLGEETSFALALLKKISPDFDPILIYENGVNLLKTSIQQRIKIVEEGYAICSSQDCSEGTDNYENWSTPSRDKRMLNNIKELENFLHSVQELTSKPLDLWKIALEEQKIELLGESHPLKLFRTIWLSKAYSSEPWDPIAKRWPFQPKDFLQQLVTRFDILISQRKQKLIGNPCVQSACSATSKEFEQYNTEVIDNEINILFLNTVYFCKNSSSERCQEFLSLISNQTYEGEPLLKALLRSHYFSSNANDNLDKRWGLQIQDNDFDLYLGLEFYFENKQGYLAVQDLFTTSLFHKGKLLKSFKKHQKMAHLFNNGALLLKDLETSTFWLYENGEFQDTELSLSSPLERINESTLLVDSTLIRDTQTGPKIIPQIPVTHFLNYNDNIASDLLTFYEDGKLKAFFLEGNQFQIITLFNFADLNGSFEIQGVAHTESSILLQAKIYTHDDNASQLIRFHKKSKTVDALPRDYQINGQVTHQVLIGQQYGKAHSFLIQYDENYNELARKDLPGLTHENPHHKTHFFVNRANESFIYEHQNELNFSIKRIATKDNQFIQHLTPSNYVLTEFDPNHFTSKSELFDLENQVLQFDSLYLIYFYSPSNLDYYLNLKKVSFGGYQQFLTWNLDEKWIEFKTKNFSLNPKENPLDPVDGELSSINPFEFNFGEQIFQSRSSILLHLPGSIAVNIRN